jgi:hypothetical protein
MFYVLKELTKSALTYKRNSIEPHCLTVLLKREYENTVIIFSIPKTLIC